mgnify:CR=1 FL=1
MARILVAAFGSLGDLHPAMAVALELQRRGHRVTVGTALLYREKIAAAGLGFHAIRPEIATVDENLVRRIMDGRRGSVFLLRDLMFPSVRAMHADLSAAVADADCLVASELVYAAPLVAAGRRVKWVSYSLAPISLFSVHDPSLLPGPPGTRLLQSLGPGANRLLRAAARARTRSWWKPVRSLRRELGLPPGGHPLFEGKYSPELDLALFSPVLQPPQSDWPAQTVQCGFPFLGEPAPADPLPAPVAAFLDRGDPPIVFTLGSSAVHVAGEFYARSATVARRLGRRALLLIGGNPPPPGLSESILAWDYLPYARIFPRAAAVVHQGGVGTTAEALRAGKPMLVMPYAHDQPDNAARVTRLGFGRTIARTHYEVPRVAQELAALLGDAAYARRAAEAGGRIRSENGAAAAGDTIEQLMR